MTHPNISAWSAVSPYRVVGDLLGGRQETGDDIGLPHTVMNRAAGQQRDSPGASSGR